MTMPTLVIDVVTHHYKLDAAFALVGQVGAAGASSGRERATWARSAASSGGGALLDQRVQ